MLKIRLRQQGRANSQTYRLVLADARTRRDGKYIEMLGWYNPTTPDNSAVVHAERVSHWVGLGADLSDCAENLMAKHAPDALKQIREKRHAKRVKLAAKRRAAKKKA